MWFLALLFSLEMGYAPFYGSANISEQLVDTNIYYVTMDMEVVVYDYFFIGGAVKTYINDKPDNYNFSPFESDYLFKAGFRYKNIEAGFRHGCGHATRPYPTLYTPQGNIDTGYEEFYVKISGGF